jgi:putative membrane protein
MKTLVSTFTLIAALGLASAASAQAVPSGGPDAKGNAPVKAVHTVNDGAPKGGANSFTQNQARKHILNSGYSDVSGLTKGADGVWRGVAVKGGVSNHVAMDFKGNVSDGGPVTTTATATAATSAMESAATTTTHTATEEGATPAAGEGVHHHRRHRHHHHWRHHHMAGDGVAKSGVDRDHNGISDKEDRALQH